MDRVLEGHLGSALPVPGPVREHEGLERGIADHATVRAAVAEGYHRPVVVQQVVHQVEVAVAVVEEGEQQQLLAFVAQHVVVEDLVCGLALALGNRPDALLRAGLVVRRIAEGEDLLQHELAVEHAAKADRLVAIGPEDPRANARVLHAFHALGERQVRDLQVGRAVQELVRLGLVAGEDAEGPRGELRHHVAAVVPGLVADLDELAPLIGCTVELQHREGDRSLDLLREALHPLDLLEGRVDFVTAGVPGRAGAGELEHAFAEVA